MTSTHLSIIVAMITGIVGPVLVLIVKHWIEKYKKSDIIDEALRLSERVTSKLDQIKDEVKADRIWLIQFHNGGHFYPTGKSIAKFSMVYETVDSGTKSIQSNFQNIPVSLFSKPINYLLENDIIEIPDFKDETVATYGLKYIAEENGTKSSYMFAIKTIEEKFIGVLAVEFTKRKTIVNEETTHLLQNQATAIGGVLNNHLQKN